MFDAGFVDEVRRLLDAGLAEGRTARTAIGYREVVAYLSGELTLDRGGRAHHDRDPAVLPAAGQLVPQGPAGRVGAVGRTRPAGDRAGRGARRLLPGIAAIRPILAAPETLGT